MVPLDTAEVADKTPHVEAPDGAVLADNIVPLRMERPPAEFWQLVSNGYQQLLRAGRAIQCKRERYLVTRSNLRNNHVELI